MKRVETSHSPDSSNDVRVRAMLDDTTQESGFVVNNLGTIQKSLFNDLELTEKQFFSFYMYANGFSDKHVANLSNCTAANVKKHLEAITKKLECNGRSELRLIYHNRLVSAQVGMLGKMLNQIN